LEESIRTEQKIEEEIGDLDKKDDDDDLFGDDEEEEKVSRMNSGMLSDDSKTSSLMLRISCSE
jgi:hypothetical protein